MVDKDNTLSRTELISIICDLGKELEGLRVELLKAKKDLGWARGILIEAQEENRRLEWALAKAEEKR